MTRNRTLTASALILALVAAGCSSLAVTTDYDSEHDFGTHKTFAWMPESEDEQYHVTGFTDQRIRNAVEKVLLSKGLTKNESNPDCFVNYLVGIQQKVDVTSTDYGSWGGRGWGRSGVDVYQYDEGTLVIDIVKGDKSQLVWRGMGRGVVEQRQYTQEDFDDIVQQIMKGYPPD